MNGKFFLAALVAAIIAFLGGWLIFGVALADFYAANINPAALILMRLTMPMWAIILVTLAWGVLITWILQKTGSTTFTRGLTTTLWISFLMALIFDLSMYASWDIYNLNIVMVDILVSSVFWALIGGIAGWIIGREKNRVLTTTT